MACFLASYIQHVGFEIAVQRRCSVQLELDPLEFGLYIPAHLS